MHEDHINVETDQLSRKFREPFQMGKVSQDRLFALIVPVSGDPVRFGFVADS